MNALGVPMQYERFRSSDDDYKRPPLPTESGNYRIRHGYKTPYLSKDSKPFVRSSSCAVENRYSLRNDRPVEPAGDSYYKPFMSGQRKTYSAESGPRESEQKYNFDARHDYSPNEDYKIPRISSYDNLFSRINEIEKQVKELKGHEFNTYKKRPPFEDNFSRTKVDNYGNKYDFEKSRNQEEGIGTKKYDGFMRDDGFRRFDDGKDQEVERLNKLLRQEKEKNQLLSSENDRLKQNLTKCENEIAKLKESQKKSPKKVSFNNTVVERSSSSWRNQLDDQIKSKYQSPYETNEEIKFPKYDFMDKKYKNENYSTYNEYYRSPNYNGDYRSPKYRDYNNFETNSKTYKSNYDYENIGRNKEKSQIDTSSQYSGGTDAILQSADNILKENNDFFSNIKNESYYSRFGSHGYGESALKSPQPKKRLMTPRTVSDLKLGDIVKFERQDGKFACGTVRYKGPIENKTGSFVGIELDQPNGRNDGSLDNKRYFYCQSNHGLFIQFEKILVCWTD